jgi:hypothetical protein
VPRALPAPMHTYRSPAATPAGRSPYRAPARRAPAPARAAGALAKALLGHCETLWPEFAAGDVSLCGAEPLPGEDPDDGGAAADFER